MEINNLIDLIILDKPSESIDAFNAIMGEKVAAIMDDKYKEVGNSFFDSATK